ncbi:MAG: hypothetical protein OHK93_007408 [Ramalina farinacea]|uniref:RING-type domain-containing protein n=1 Tax=Ramalina farinacea TaxID=258253 RepID=A0AA43QML5_9LECA|nr:hypothetical protein [Ramalina farinacea]
MTDDFVPSRLHSIIKAHFEFHQLRSLYPEKSSSYLYPIMLTQATYQQAGIPFDLLGLSYQKWRSDDLRLLLNNFGITTMEAVQKIDLMHGLHHLIENGLMPDDPDIVARLQQGRSLPTFSGVNTLALRGRTLEDLLGGELTSARIKSLQRQRRAFTSEDFALPSLNASSPIPSSGPIAPQADAEAGKMEDRDDDKILFPAKTDCVVCMDPLTAEVQDSSKITSACNHRRDVCDECLQQAITVDLEEKVWDRIGCPSCGTLLAQEDVIRHGDPKAVAK